MNLRKRIVAILKRSPFLASFLHLLFNQLSSGVVAAFKMKVFRMPSFSYLEMKSVLDSKGVKEVVVLGSGRSILQLKDDDFEALKSRLTIGIGRWIFHEFVPDYYFLEVSEKGKLNQWLIDFLALLNEKKHEYRNTIIVFGTSNQQIRAEIHKVLDVSLIPNIRYSIVLKPPSGNGMFAPFVKLANSLAAPLKFGFLLHCRSSTAAMAMCGFYTHADRVLLAGVDGYTGYFSDDPDFHKDYGGLEKNYKHQLHSTSNPKFGYPTLPQCLSAIDQSFIRCETITTDTVMDDVLGFHRI